MDFGFDTPEVLLLLAPAALAWWALARGGAGRAWRLALLALLVIAAAGPELTGAWGGSDVILVLDRSASMGEERDAQQGIVDLVASARGARDRLAVVLVGDGARVALAPSARGTVALGDHVVGEGASALSDGLEAAAALVAPGRSARVIVHSDGEATGPSTRQAVARLAGRGAVVDALPVARPPVADAAVVGVEVPVGLRRGESFIGTARFVGEVAATAAYRVVRVEAGADGVVREVEVAAGEVALRADEVSAVRFADRPARVGLVRYEARLEAGVDRVPENDRGAAALLVEGGEAALVVGGDGAPGNLARALGAAGLEVVTRAEGPLTLAELLAYRVVVLEQVPAARLGLEGMVAVARWVERFGGGLVMTGGPRGFGAGGYHQSPVEAVLPVTMEIRDEHRKLAMAMAITLDRSGSMAAPVADGRTKMELATAGVAATLGLMGPSDRVAVHAVDTGVHVVVPLTAVEDGDAIAQRVRSIRSGGGGIYVHEALTAAGRELARPGLGTRHLLMFADAADAEAPGAWEALVKAYVEAGITVSVIGLGREDDPDAALLKGIAAAGGGRAWFTDRAEDLPRVFAQETLLVSRTAWVREVTPMEPTARVVSVLGAAEGLNGDDGAWPAIGGYNVTHARPGAQVLAVAAGDPVAPAVAVGRAGAGRAAVVAFDVDPAEGGVVVAWPGYGALLSGLARWAGGADGEAMGALSVVREGGTARVVLELDPERRAEWPSAPPELTLSADGEIGAGRVARFAPVDDGVYEARVALEAGAVVLPAVALGAPGAERAVFGPALTLPYSPEVEPRWGRPSGEAALAALARDGGGAVRGDLEGVYDNPASEGVTEALAPWLVALALVALVGEVVVRRLRLSWPRLRWRRRRVAPPVGAGEGEASEAPPGSSPVDATTRAAAPPSAPEGTGVGDALRELRRRRR